MHCFSTQFLATMVRNKKVDQGFKTRPDNDIDKHDPVIVVWYDDMKSSRGL